MQVALKYGHGERVLAIPDSVPVEVLRPASLPPLADPAQALGQALDRPLAGPLLADMPQPASVAVAVPDETRPLPVRELLPVLLDRLLAAWPGLGRDRVTVVVGGGLHPPLDRAELDRLVPPDAARGCRVLGHDARAADLADMGVTSRGTPVRIHPAVARAELRVVLGQVDPHQFVGFTGGAKGIAIGCASAETIARNHGLMFQAGARVGELDANPVRQDLNEAGRIIGVRLAVNLVLGPDKRPAWLAAGDPEAVLRAGAGVCARIYGVRLEHDFDLVAASCGGHPKDICLYQAQKGLNQASAALRPGGRLLLLAACGQGVGDEAYLDYVRRFASPQEVLEDFAAGGFRMGAHKAFLFSRTLAAHRVVVDSELDPAVLRQCHLTPGPAQETLDRWIAECSGRPRVAVVPNANTTYFFRDPA